VASDTFCAVLIAPSNWLTRCEIGALDPTHGQLDAACAVVAGVIAPATAKAPAVAPATVSAASDRTLDKRNLRMMPPDTRFTNTAKSVRQARPQPAPREGFFRNIN
jgi:hypothetical protein